jgi:hypothetical protein
MKKNIILSFAMLIILGANAQLKVGDNPTTINASAILEIESTNQGLLFPRMTTAQRDASIKSPTAGLIIYNTSTNALEVTISGSLWLNILTGATTAVASGTTTSVGGIGVGTSTPNANAVLDVTSTTKGVLLPRLSSDPTGVAGMVYYNTTSNTVKLYNGTSWITLTN